jgi:ParB family transcriptional regulator, chromosome partitioning protein
MNAHDSHPTSIISLEPHQIELRFQRLRIQNAKGLDLLSQSIAEAGQLVPVQVIPSEQQDSWILIDGYQRFEALQRLKIEQIQSQVLTCGEKQALLLHMAQGQSRTWEAIEEAGLIYELHKRLGHSLREIAASIGKSPSWVQRRLALILEMPQEILDRVIQGHLSTWAATRIFLPLARANTEHAQTLLGFLDKESLSTRQLQDLWCHYKQSSRKVRENIIQDPGLFLKVLKEQEMDKEAQKIQLGADGAWFEDLQVIGHILLRLQKSIPHLFHFKQADSEQVPLLTALDRTQEQWERLQRNIQKEISHDRSRTTADHLDPAPERNLHPGDRKITENIPEHGPVCSTTQESGGADSALH